MSFANAKGWSTVVVAAIAVWGILAAAPTEAAPTLTFDQIDNFGTVSYDGLGGALVGSGINFETILGTGTPLNDGVLIDCTGCSLDFTSGTNVSDDGTNYTWAGGGTFTITGTSIAAGIFVPTALVTGSFSSVSAVLTSGGQLLVTGFGTDVKDDALSAYYGVDPEDWRFVESSINVTGVTVGPGSAFDASLGIPGATPPINFGNADFVNSMPIPGSVSLLLLGLTGLAAFTRRKQ